LAENLQSDPRVIVLDAGRWAAVHGEKSFSQRMWYMSKTPYSVELFKEAALEIRSTVRALTGQTKKLIVLDLDDTLWGGVVGDLGWQNLRIGGHDPVGEAFKDFQLALQALKRKGVLLGIVSKNEESTALEAIGSHPEMALRKDDFAGWRINWQDKAQNIADLATELNLGLQSVVFIDDNPAERARVQEALPEVLVPDWPLNPMEYPLALEKLRCFDKAEVTAEDGQRSAMYVLERKRRAVRAEVGSLDQWLETLEVRVLVEGVNPANLERVTQLLNKTNQMNLSTRRLTRDELWDWTRQPENKMLAFRVADKFGDYGLVGIGSFSNQSEGAADAVLVDFILSCRAMGREVERAMMHVLLTAARAAGARFIRAEYLPTPKNQPCLAFLKNSELTERDKSNVFVWDLEQEYLKPSTVTLLSGANDHPSTVLEVLAH
jgi:FkbH-like protein